MLAARAEAIMVWEQIALALARSKDPEDVRLAVEAVRYLAEVAPGGQEAARLAARAAKQHEDEPSKGASDDPAATPDRARSPNRYCPPSRPSDCGRLLTGPPPTAWQDPVSTLCYRWTPRNAGGKADIDEQAFA